MDWKSLGISLGVCLVAVILGNLLYDLTIEDAVTSSKASKEID